MAQAVTPAHSQQVYRTRALGTIAELVTDAGPLFAASEMLDSELERIDLAASRFRSDSDLSRLNATAGAEVVVGPDLFEAMDKYALTMAEATDGLVDPTVGAAMNRLGYDRDFADVVSRGRGGAPVGTSRPGVALGVRRPGSTLRPAPGGYVPRPRRHGKGARHGTERRRPSTAGSGVACSSRSAAMCR